VSHSWYSFYNGLVGIDDAEGLLPPVLDAMRQLALELDVPFYGFPGVAETDVVTPVLREAGFRRAYTEATSAYLVPPRGGLDGYYASLKKSRRADMRRLVNKAVREGVEVSWDRDLAFVEELGRQLRDVCERHSSPLSNPPENLRSIFSNLDPFLELLTLWYRGEMLGGFVLLEFNGVLYAWIISMNYAFNRRFGTYFVLFALMVERAHERGVARIEVGRGGYPMKIRLGFRPIELVSWFRATSPDDDATLADGFARMERALQTRSRIAAAYAEAGIPAPPRPTPSVLEATKLDARPLAEAATTRRRAC
jgi:Acetyltransferase (GNAT) domain